MSAIGNIRDEINEFNKEITEQSKNVKLKGSGGTVELCKRNINSVVYTAEMKKSELSKAPKIVIKSINEGVVVECKAGDFSESKLKHAVLKHQWKERKHFSLEQKAQLYAAADGHGIGKSGEKVTLEGFRKECLQVAQDGKASITQRADALLRLCAMYNSFRPEDKRSSDNFDIINILSNRDESFTCRTIVNGLFDAIKDPNLPKEEREKAGELLAKIYNNPEIPQSVKNEIHKQIQTMAHEACVATISARLGLPKEVVQEMVPQNGIVSIAMMANYKTEIVDRNDFGKNITTRRPYNESEIAGINEHYTLTPGNKIGHSEMQVEFFYGEPKDKPGLKPEDNPVPPILYIPIQESVKDFEGEMIEIRNGFPNASFEEKNNILSKVLSLSERDFDSAISVSNSLKLLDVHALGFSAGVVRSTSEFSKNEDLKQEVKKVLKDEVEKIVQEYNKNPDSNALSEEQKNNIVKAWSVAMGGQKTFEEIAVEIANK